MKQLLAVAVVAAVLVAPAVAAACAHPRTSLVSLEGQVMCPVCHTTLDQSDSATAQAIKRFIARRIAACETAGQIKRELVDSFGEAILAAPPKKGFDLLAWWLPLGGIILGAAAIGGGVWRWSRTRDDAGALGGEPARTGGDRLDPELERRVDEALARFEG